MKERTRRQRAMPHNGARKQTRGAAKATCRSTDTKWRGSAGVRMCERSCAAQSRLQARSSMRFIRFAEALTPRAGDASGDELMPDAHASVRSANATPCRVTETMNARRHIAHALHARRCCYGVMQRDVCSIRAPLYRRDAAAPANR